MRHCREDKINRIITKSISRFSRNTRDFLTSLEALRANNSTIVFEKENIDTLNANSELFPFDEYVFRTFVLRMEAAGDEIRYGMSFGLILTGAGNSRPIRAYLGYRRIKKDGSVEVIERAEQLAPGKIQCRRRVKKAAKPDPLSENMQLFSGNGRK